MSSVGTQVSQLAFPLLVLALTHSPAEAGLIAAIRTIPYAFLILPVGALVDRWDRKRLMISSDAGRALALATVPLALYLGHLAVLQLAAVSFIEGTLFTFFNVAEAACIPRVVGKEQLASAVSQTQVVDSIATLVGPALGGALFGIASAVPFLADAISYGGSVMSLSFIRAKFQTDRQKTASNILPEIAEGIVWLWRHRIVRYLAFVTGLLNLFSSGYPLIMIVRAQQFHASPAIIGVLFASGGIGGVVGAVAARPLLRRFTVGQVMIVAVWVWALTWLPYAFAPNLLWLGIVNVIGWFVVPIFTVTQFSYRLIVIPDALQGRVNSIYKLIAFGGQPLSLLLTGVLLQLFGPVRTILIIFAPQFVLAALIQCHRGLRATGRMSDATEA